MTVLFEVSIQQAQDFRWWGYLLCEEAHKELESFFWFWKDNLDQMAVSSQFLLKEICFLIRYLSLFLGFCNRCKKRQDWWKFGSLLLSWRNNIIFNLHQINGYRGDFRNLKRSEAHKIELYTFVCLRFWQLNWARLRWWEVFFQSFCDRHSHVPSFAKLAHSLNRRRGSGFSRTPPTTVCISESSGMIQMTHQVNYLNLSVSMDLKASYLLAILHLLLCFIDSLTVVNFKTFSFDG